jgi:hypothetical protein
MKASNGIIARLTALIKQHPLRFIITLSGVILLTELACFGPTFFFDTKDYFNAWNNISQGSIDLLRTPSYPIIVGLVSTICGNHAGYVIVLIQIATCLISIKYFWFLSYKLSSNKKISFASTILYALLPGICDYSLVLMTESFAISGVIFLIASLVKIYDSFKYRYSIAIVFLTLFLIFLRPALLYILVLMPIVGVIWLLKKREPQFVALLTATILSCILLYGYCRAYENKTGVFMISSVSLINDEMLIHMEDFDKLLSFDKEPSIKILNKYAKVNSFEFKWDWIQDLQHSFSIKDHAKFVCDSKSQIGFKWYTHAIIRFYDSMGSPMLKSYIDNQFLNCYLPWYIPIRMNVAYDILLIYIVLNFCLFLRHKSFSWINVTLVLACLGNIGVMVIGSYADWDRLFVPSIPITLLIGAQLINCVKRKNIEYCTLLN